ncbi:MAG: SMI1/KNR4 family protein [Desulfomonilia bacterium]
MYKTRGASDELIAEAERQLNLRFAEDYKEYLSLFGAISFGSTELTGLILIVMQMLSALH